MACKQSDLSDLWYHPLSSREMVKMLIEWTGDPTDKHWVQCLCYFKPTAVVNGV